MVEPTVILGPRSNDPDPLNTFRGGFEIYKIFIIMTPQFRYSIFISNNVEFISIKGQMCLKLSY